MFHRHVRICAMYCSTVCVITGELVLRIFGTGDYKDRNIDRGIIGVGVLI